MSTKHPTKRKKSLLPSLEDLQSEAKRHRATCKNVHDSCRSLLEVDLFELTPGNLGKITNDEKLCWLISQYSFAVVAKVCSFMKSLPSALTEQQKNAIIQEELPELSPEIIKKMLSFVTSELSDAIGCFTANEVVILAPPVDRCYECQQLLSPYNSCQVRCYTRTGAVYGHKFTFRCIRCKLLYNYAQFGNKHELGFRYYPIQRDFVEASDTAYMKRNLLELQCSLANHAWVSFQGFGESFNDAFSVTKELELSPHTVSEAFYSGELEAELRRIGQIDYRFRYDSDRETCMEMIERMRRKTLYEHPPADCVEECKKRGCGRLYVTDGIWKTVFPHCMFRVENIVPGIPTLSLPDVCTASPLRGKAFCNDHCKLLEKEAPQVPLGLREFLSYCGGKSAEDVESYGDGEGINKVVNQLKISSNDVGESAAECQGTSELIAAHPTIVSHAHLLENPSEPLCRKDTGKKLKLRKWSRGHQFIVRGGGHIETFQPLFQSESPSQVFLILIQWLLSFSKSGGDISNITLAYDNMCNIERMHVARKPLPLPPPMDRAWMNVDKVIDVFHFGNHVSPQCKERFSPAKLKEENPDFNTQAGEQTFVWISRFQHILCSMPKNHHLFYLHRMVLRRNAYTAKCYKKNKKPILPKVTHAD